MTEKTRFFSIKRLFIWVVMGVASLALLVTSSIFIYSQVAVYEKKIHENAMILAEMLSTNATDVILKNDKVTEADNLQVLEATTIVTNAHVYKVMENGELSFFASYNRSGRAPVQAMFHRIEELHTPKLLGGVLEVVRPIKNGDEVVGYIYVRASTYSIKNITLSITLITLGVVAVVLFLCFLLTLRLQRLITEPIQNLVDVVHIIAQRKDYSQRAKKSSVRELDVLVRAFNTMLERIQAHIQAQMDAEHEYRNLAANLEETVSQRTLALKESNGELIQTLEKLHQFQRQMVENEKMASLGDMVAGVAHEVNTPIGLGVTASTMMLDRLAKLKSDFETKTLKASSLEKFIGESEENLNIIYRNLNRSAELISSFKQVAVDQSSEEDRVFSFTQLMDEVVLSLKPRLKSYNHKIEVDCDSSLHIESKAGPINQIMINLIMNSVIHAFENIDAGTIKVTAHINDSSVFHIEYEDNGQGIPENLSKRIFDPFVTTKRGQGGSGLGMHLVYNLVTQALNGSINLTTEEGQGVHFSIEFPVRVVTNLSPKRLYNNGF